MPEIKHILFPIDFSDRCCAVAPFVAAMATRYGAKITLLNAEPPFLYAGLGEPGYPIVVDPQELVEELKARLDEALVEEFAKFQVDRVVELGEPAQTITGFAHAHAVDLIMMPTHGYGPFRTLLLGSVTAKVLHHASCPVWTAVHAAKAPCRGHITCQNVLCAVDQTPRSVAVMQWAAGFSHDAGATLRLVHAMRGMEGVPAHQLDREFEEDVRREARQRIEDLQKIARVTAPLCVETGNVAETVAEEARRHKADVVVIGRGELRETMGRLRTHTYGVIRQSPCPVLSV